MLGLTLLDELTLRFGPSKVVAPWGDCLVVQGTEFDPDWEAELADLGYRCHFGSLDNHAVTFVQLKKLVAPGKTVYVPPVTPKPADPDVGRIFWSAQEDAYLIELWKSGLPVEQISLSFAEKFPVRVGNAVKSRLDRLKIAGKIQSRKHSGNMVKEVEKVDSKVEVRGCQSGPDWSASETALLLDYWEDLKALPKAKRAIEIARMEEFAGRSADALYQKVYKLLKAKASKEAKSSPETSKVDVCIENAPGTLDKRSVNPDSNERIIDEANSGDVWKSTGLQKSKVDGADVLVDLVKNYQILSEAYDSQSKAFVELKEDFEAYAKLQSEISEAHREELNALTAKYAKLQKEVSRHKHAVSGEAMIPLEAS
jgi:hypothetical protein